MHSGKEEFRGQIQTIQWNNRIISGLLMIGFLVSIALFVFLIIGTSVGVVALFDPHILEDIISNDSIFLRAIRLYLKVLIFIGGATILFLRRSLKNIEKIFNASPLGLAHNHPFFQTLENLCISRGLRVPELFVIKGLPAHFVMAVVVQDLRGHAKVMLAPRAMVLLAPLQEALAAQVVQRIYTRDTLFLTLFCFLGYFPFHMFRQSSKFFKFIWKPFLVATDWSMIPIRRIILNVRSARLDVGALVLTKEKGPMHDLMKVLTPLKEIEIYYHEPYLPLFIARSEGAYRLRMLERA